MLFQEYLGVEWFGSGIEFCVDELFEIACFAAECGDGFCRVLDRGFEGLFTRWVNRYRVC